MPEAKSETQSILSSLILFTLGYLLLTLSDRWLGHAYALELSWSYVLAMFLVAFAAAHHFTNKHGMPPEGRALIKLVCVTVVIILVIELLSGMAFKLMKIAPLTSKEIVLLTTRDAAPRSFDGQSYWPLMLVVATIILFLAFLNWLAMGPFTRWIFNWRQKRTKPRIIEYITGQDYELLSGRNYWAILTILGAVLIFWALLLDVGRADNGSTELRATLKLMALMGGIFSFASGIMQMMHITNNLKLYEDRFCLRIGFRKIWCSFNDCGEFKVTQPRIFGIPLGSCVDYNLLNPTDQSSFWRAIYGSDQRLPSNFGRSAEALAAKMNDLRLADSGNVASNAASMTARSALQRPSKTPAVSGIMLVYAVYALVVLVLYQPLFSAIISQPFLHDPMRANPISVLLLYVLTLQIISALPAIIAGGLYLSNVEKSLEGIPLAAMVLFAVLLDFAILDIHWVTRAVPEGQFLYASIAVICAEILLYWFYFGPLNRWMAEREVALA